MSNHNDQPDHDFELTKEELISRYKLVMTEMEEVFATRSAHIETSWLQNAQVRSEAAELREKLREAQEQETLWFDRTRFWRENCETARDQRDHLEEKYEALTAEHMALQERYAERLALHERMLDEQSDELAMAREEVVRLTSENDVIEANEAHLLVENEALQWALRSARRREEDMVRGNKFVMVFLVVMGMLAFAVGGSA